MAKLEKFKLVIEPDAYIEERIFVKPEGYKTKEFSILGQLRKDGIDESEIQELLDKGFIPTEYKPAKVVFRKKIVPPEENVQ